MSEQNLSSRLTRKQLRTIPLENPISLEIPENIESQIRFLCKAIPNVEWSGVLFYSVEGSIKDFENLKLKVEHIHPMNKGTSAYTEYSFDDSVVEYRMSNPESLKWKIGHIHSHNKMNVFFSGTDKEELEDNSPLHNYYLSLIVNNFNEMEARVAFIGKVRNYVCLDEKGEEYNLELTDEEEVMFTFPVKIVTTTIPITVSENFIDRVEYIIKEAANRPAPPAKTIPATTGWKDKDFHNKKTYTDKPYTNKSSKSIVDFTRYIARMGDDDIVGDSMDAALMDLTIGNINTIEIVTKIVGGYPDLFEKYWGNVDMEKFIDTTLEVIDAFNDYEEDYLYITPLCEAMEKMIDNLMTIA